MRWMLFFGMLATVTVFLGSTDDAEAVVVTDGTTAHAMSLYLCAEVDQTRVPPSYPPSVGGASELGMRWIAAPGQEYEAYARSGGGYWYSCGVSAYHTGLAATRGGCNFGRAPCSGYVGSSGSLETTPGSGVWCPDPNPTCFHYGSGDTSSTYTLDRFLHPSGLHPHAYQEDITIHNFADVPIDDVRHQRCIDWHIDPTPGNEAMEWNGITPMPAKVEAIGSPDTQTCREPQDGWTDAGCASSGTYTTCGPGDHSMGIRLNFGTLPPGGAATACMFRGASADKATALGALEAIGAQVYNLAQSTSAGAANDNAPTFFIAFSCLEPPEIDFTMAPDPVCAAAAPSVGMPVTFTDLSTMPAITPLDPASSAWDFGDGNTQSTSWSPSVTHSYDLPGTYTVTLNVTDIHGLNSTLSKTLTVVDCSPPPPEDEPPVITTAPDACTYVTQGTLVSMRFAGTDPDAGTGDPEDFYVLEWAILEGPPGAWIDTTGRLRWEASEPGAYVFQVVLRESAHHGMSDETQACVFVDPKGRMPENTDSDGDGAMDSADACPATAGSGGCKEVEGEPVDEEQPDEEPDPVPEHPLETPAAVPDSDRDGVLDPGDNCVETMNALQEDLDGDGIGDACDLDIDGDRVHEWDDRERLDNCPYTYNPLQNDDDKDGIGDACAGDRDADGVTDVDASGRPLDNCVWTPNPGQADEDEDGVGDACTPQQREAGDDPTVVQEATTGAGPGGLAVVMGGVLLVMLALVALVLMRRRRDVDQPGP